MRVTGGLIRLVLATALAGVLVAGLLLPYAVGVGLASNHVTDAIATSPGLQINEPFPERTTVTDKDGKPLAYIYDQNRVVVPYAQISLNLVHAVVSVEDRRFYTHQGVDWRGTVRALLKNSQGELGQQGGSTLTQQMVKNYRYLVQARTDAEKADAIAATPLRKLQEAKIALTLELPGPQGLTKDQIMGDYLNLVAFGPSVYGAQAAAQYFFGVDASALTVPQAALLAGMVNNPNKYNPFNPDRITDAKVRRDLVLKLMGQTGYLSAAQVTQYQASPLGSEQHVVPNGCLSGPTFATNGYFCQYVLDFLTNSQGLSTDDIARGGYTVRSTLDPSAMSKAKKAVDKNADPANPAYSRVANVIAIVQPGVGIRKVLALAANRPYGLNKSAGQTVQRLPTTFAPLGAGSTFKIFTAAEALREGLGTSSVIDNPNGYASPLAPTHTINNSGTYPDSMPLSQALATSPNTAFVKLEDEMGLDKVVQMAVALGLKGYSLPAGDVDRAFTGSGRTYADEVVAQKIASFTLGVTPVSPTELANVGATLASNGQWCQPTPVDVITDRNNQVVTQKQTPCAQAVPAELANSLAQAMEGDWQSPTYSPGGGVPPTATGTAARAAAAAVPAWNHPLASKTGTTEDYKSSAFLGFTPLYSASVMTWDYLDNPKSICVNTADSTMAGTCPTSTAMGDPAKPTLHGMSGGTVPAATWFDAVNSLQTSSPIFNPGSAQYQAGSQQSNVPNTINQTADAARATLTGLGFTVSTQLKCSGAALNTVIGQNPLQSALPGGQITLTISRGPAAAGASCT